MNYGSLVASAAILACVQGCGRDWEFLEPLPQPEEQLQDGSSGAPASQAGRSQIVEGNGGAPAWNNTGGSGLAGSDGGAAGSGGSSAGNTGSSAGATNAALKEVVWARSAGGPALSDSAYDVAVDSLGDSIFVGSVGSSTTFGCNAHSVSDSSDAFIVKYSADGRCRWSHSFGAATSGSRVTATAVATTKEDDVIVAGFVDNAVNFGGETLYPDSNWDVFIAKFSGDGKHIWSRNYGTRANEWTWDLAVDSTGGIYVTGHYDRSTDLGSGALSYYGSNDAFVAKFADANDASGGTPVWSRGYGSTGEQIFRAIGVGPNGELISAGYTVGTVKVDGIETRGSTGPNIIVTRHEPDGGKAIWSRTFGGLADDQAQTISVLDASVVISGWFYGSVVLGEVDEAREALLLELELAKGETLWAEQLAGASKKSKIVVAGNRAGGIAIGGCAIKELTAFGLKHAPSAGKTNLFTLAFDAKRQLVWAADYSASTLCDFRALSWDAAGSLVFAGAFSETIAVQAPPLTSGGDRDMFFGRLKPYR